MCWSQCGTCMMNTNIPVLRNISFPKLLATSICISSTRSYSESGLYCCDAAVRNMRYTKEGSFEPKGKLKYLLSKQIIWKHWIHASHCHSLVLCKLCLHNATHRLLVQIQSKSFLQATLSSVALYTYIHSVPYVSELCWENPASSQFPEFECWHT